MPSVPEYILKYNELTVLIGKYVNLLPFNPEDLKYESSLYDEIQDLKNILDTLLIDEPKDFKNMFYDVYRYFYKISEQWNLEREMMNY